MKYTIELTDNDVQALNEFIDRDSSYLNTYVRVFIRYLLMNRDRKTNNPLMGNKTISSIEEQYKSNIKESKISFYHDGMFHHDGVIF